MKKIILILILLPIFGFSQNPMNNKKMAHLAMMKKKMIANKSKMKAKHSSNSFNAKKMVENKIINKWEEYSKAFEYSDFEKIKTYFTYPVTLSVFGDPIIVDNEKDLMNWYKQIRNDVQEGYKYSMLEKSRVIWISKDLCMVDATYSGFNASYERIFTTFK